MPLVKQRLIIERFHNNKGKAVSLNAALLEDGDIKKEIELEFRNMMADCPGHWDNGMKLEFAKCFERSKLAALNTEK